MTTPFIIYPMTISFIIYTISNYVHYGSLVYHLPDDNLVYYLHDAKLIYIMGILFTFFIKISQSRSWVVLIHTGRKLWDVVGDPTQHPCSLEVVPAPNVKPSQGVGMKQGQGVLHLDGHSQLLTTKLLHHAEKDVMCSSVVSWKEEKSKKDRCHFFSVVVGFLGLPSAFGHRVVTLGCTEKEHKNHPRDWRKNVQGNSVPLLALEKSFLLTLSTSADLSFFEWINQKV